MFLRAAVCMAGVAVMVSVASPDSMYSYGFHSWSPGCDLLVMNGKTGFHVIYCNVEQGPPRDRLIQAHAEGFTPILGLSNLVSTKDDPGTIYTIARDCAEFADEARDLCHIYHVGNEMDLIDAVTEEQFARAFRVIADAIHSVQPEAIVGCGAPIGLSYFENMADQLGDEADGYQAHVNVPQQFFWYMQEVPGGRHKPMYMTEWTRTPYPTGAFQEFFDDVQAWNSQYPDQRLTAGCYFVYDLAGWDEFSVVNYPQAIADYSQVTSTTAVTNRYADRPITTDGLTISRLSDSAVLVSWTTNVGSTTQVAWHEDGDDDSSYSTFTADLALEHSKIASNLSPWEIYNLMARSTGVGYGDLAAGPYRFGTASSSKGLPTGWSLISLPLRMPYTYASAVLRGPAPGSLEANLYGYRSGEGYSIYPNDFTELQRGRGYWLRLDEGALCEQQGAKASGTQEVALTSGWNLIGHPLEVSVPLSVVQVSDDTQTFTLAEAEAAGWLQATLYSYDSGYVDQTPSSGVLQPWAGYWLLSYRSGLSLLIDRQ